MRNIHFDDALDYNRLLPTAGAHPLDPGHVLSHKVIQSGELLSTLKVLGLCLWEAYTVKNPFPRWTGGCPHFTDLVTKDPGDFLP